MKNLALILKSILIALCFNYATFAQDVSAVPGAFADIGFGARPTAMGGAFVGLADDANATFWNPAGLANISSSSMNFTFARQLGLINYHSLTYVMPLNAKQTGLGFALIYSGDEALTEMTAQAGYARSYGSFLIGLNLKYRYASFGKNSLSATNFPIFEPDEITLGISNQVKGSANGFGFDLGLMYLFTDKIAVGIMLRDIYSPVSWNSDNDNPVNKPKGKYSETVPFEGIGGVSFKIFDELLFTIDYSPAFQSEVNDKIKAGAEAMFFKMVYLRAGMQQMINNFDDEKYVLGAGLNITQIKNLRVMLDYTFMFEELANTHRFSLGLGF